MDVRLHAPALGAPGVCHCAVVAHVQDVLRLL